MDSFQTSMDLIKNIKLTEYKLTFHFSRYGRKKAAYLFIIANSILNICLSVLINTEMKDVKLQQTLFGVLRLLCGIASNVYAVAVVIGNLK